MTFDESFDIDKAALLYGGDCGTVLAMAYVPVQQWGDLYAEELALQKGTLFADLDKPFLGGRQVRNGQR